ncbi:arginase family protein [Streptomyces sp. NPDC054786]
MRRTILIDAPSNLGLRPPAPGTVPGCYKLAGALREQGLLRRLGALEGGVVVPPRYDLGEWREGDGDFNAAALAVYTGDADVLDPSVMPAVDSPDPGGLLTGELRVLLGPLAASPRCAGINVTIYDPDRDPDGTGAALLADLLEDLFAQP